jgi:hypothetical protein
MAVITPLASSFSMILSELRADSDVITALKSFITLATGQKGKKAKEWQKSKRAKKASKGH